MSDIKLAKGMLEDAFKIIRKQIKLSQPSSDTDLFFTSIHVADAINSIQRVITNEEGK